MLSPQVFLGVGRVIATVLAAFGKNVLFAKVRAAAIAGVLAGAAGGIYAVYLSFIDPTDL